MGPLNLTVTWSTYWRARLRAGISKPRRLYSVKFDFSLFWMSQTKCIVSSPTRRILCRVYLQRAHYIPVSQFLPFLLARTSTIVFVHNFPPRILEREAKTWRLFSLSCTTSVRNTEFFLPYTILQEVSTSSHIFHWKILKLFNFFFYNRT